MMISLILPFPPSNNTYWRHPGNGLHLISERGRAYRRFVADVVMIQRIGSKPLAGDLDVQIVACRPNKLRRDLDNIPKAVLDSLTKARLWIDDSQIQKLSIEWGEYAKGGELRVYVSQFEPLIK